MTQHMEQAINGIPPIFVISLNRSQERRKSVDTQLNALGLKFSFYDAVDGKSLSKEELSQVDFSEAKQVCGHDLSYGEVGCAMSHIRLYNKMINEDIKEMIILEDDLSLVPDFLAVIKKLSSTKPSRAELIYLYHGKAKSYPIKRKMHACYKLARLRIPSKNSKRFITGTVAYYINQKAAKKLLKQALPIRMPSDYLIGFIQKNKVNTYAVEPCCIELGGFDSTIDDRNYGNHVQPC